MRSAFFFALVVVVLLMYIEPEPFCCGYCIYCIIYVQTRVDALIFLLTQVFAFLLRPLYHNSETK